MYHRLKRFSVRRAVAVVAVMLTAVALLAGCAAPVSMASAGAQTVRTLSTGYVPSAAAAANSSGSCGGVCYGYEPQDEPQAAQSTKESYAGGGCVVGRANNTQTACVCCGTCESGLCESGNCDEACADGSCCGDGGCADGSCADGGCAGGGCMAGRLASGSLCGAGASAQRGCVASCVN